MKRLFAYRGSTILNVRVKYGKEMVSFNLGTELKIDENKINQHLKTQPVYYGFCLMLHKKLTTKFEETKMERKRVYGRLFLSAKENKVMNGRPYSDDAAKVYVESHKSYLAATSACIKAKDDADALFTCIRAMEQRAFLLQSLSANNRKEV